MRSITFILSSFVGLLLLIVSSCTKLPEYISLHQDVLDLDEATYSGYDSENGLRWLVFHDDTTFHLWIDTEEQASIRKMVFGGVTATLTSTQKDADEWKVNYPLGGDRKCTLEDFQKYAEDIQLTNNTILDQWVSGVSTDLELTSPSGTQTVSALYDKDQWANVSVSKKGQYNIEYKASWDLRDLGLENEDELIVVFQTGSLDLDYGEDPTRQGVDNSGNVNPNSFQSPAVIGGLGSQQKTLGSYNALEASVRVKMKVTKTE